MKIKNDKLKVYEFLFNRVHFTDKELKEYEHLKRMNTLESLFNAYLKRLNRNNLDVYWHLTLPINSKKETIECMIVTACSIHLFKILDLKGNHEVNSLNLLLKDNIPVLDLNITKVYYETMKNIKIEQEHFLKPIFFNYVVLNDTFSVTKNTSISFLTPTTLTHYLKNIEITRVKKYKRLEK